MRLATIFCVLIFPPNGLRAGPRLCHAWRAAISADFTHYNYASPNACRGHLKTSANRRFDSLNRFPFAVMPRKTFVNACLKAYWTAIMTSHSLYGLLAETVTQRPIGAALPLPFRQAKFADGKPVTAADVALRDSFCAIKGAPIIVIIMIKSKP